LAPQQSEQPRRPTDEAKSPSDALSSGIFMKLDLPKTNIGLISAAMNLPGQNAAHRQKSLSSRSQSFFCHGDLDRFSPYSPIILVRRTTHAY